jgi:ATPase subunit of ABC transporter with duplicated ATPase domains
VYQGKRDGVREQRIAAARELARSVRRALMVDLPLELEMPDLPARAGQPIIAIDGVTASARGSCLFESLTLSIERERLAVVGPNGSGKTTLLEIMVGARVPDAGVARSMRHRLGYVAQHAQNWLSNESLAALLLTSSDAETLSDVARHLACHRFPLALAERPLWTLSPGERTRAALLCLYRRHPPVELLVLDEPTDQLDLVGVAALERALAAWPGGLVVVSHDEEFLERVGVTARVELGQGRAKCSGQPA